MLARLASIKLGIVLLFLAGTAQAQTRPAENPAALQAACDRNDAAACRKLGMLYNGAGPVPANKVMAARLLRKSCEGGDNHGCVLLGITLRLGDGVPQDRVGEMAAFGKACDAGYGDACSKLSHNYLYGWGVAKDIARVNQLQGRACELGDWSSKYSCLELADRLYTGVDTPKNVSEAFRLLQRACDLNNFKACGMLAGFYFAGEDIAPDRARAFRLAVKACDGNAASGCTVAAFILTMGAGGQPQNQARAALLLQKACDLKLAIGCQYLGKAYDSGEGVARDPVKAASFARMACELDKQHCALAAASAASPTRAAPTPSTQVRATDFTVLGVTLGADSLQTVQAVLKNSGATVADSPGDKLYDQRLKALSGNFSGINPRYSVIAFDFKNTGSATTLVDVIVIYPGGNLSMMHERAAALVRAFGPSDMPPHIAYHKLVRGAEIILYYDSRTSQLNEHYRVPGQGS